jgi:hypothetical protein
MWSGRWAIPGQPTASGCTRTGTPGALAGPAATGRALVPDVPHPASPPATTAAAMLPTILDALPNGELTPLSL